MLNTLRFICIVCLLSSAVSAAVYQPLIDELDISNPKKLAGDDLYWDFARTHPDAGSAQWGYDLFFITATQRYRHLIKTNYDRKIDREKLLSKAQKKNETIEIPADLSEIPVNKSSFSDDQVTVIAIPEAAGISMFMPGGGAIGGALAGIIQAKTASYDKHNFVDMQLKAYKKVQDETTVNQIICEPTSKQKFYLTPDLIKKYSPHIMEKFYLHKDGNLRSEYEGAIVGVYKYRPECFAVKEPLAFLVNPQHSSKNIFRGIEYGYPVAISKPKKFLTTDFKLIN